MTEEKKNLSGTQAAVAMGGPAMQAAIHKGVAFALRGIRDTAALRPLFNIVAQAGDLSKFAEGGVNTLFQQFGSGFFKSRVYEDFWKHTAGTVVRTVAEVSAEIQSGKTVTSGEVEAKVAAAVKSAADELLYVLDEGGQMHRRACPHVIGRVKRLVKVSIMEAANEGYPLSGCCADNIKKEAKIRMPKPAAPARPKFQPGQEHSFMDVVGMLDDKDRSAFIAWLETLSDEDLAKLMRYGPFIDTEAELIALVSLPPAMRMKMLAGLKTKADEREAPKRAINSVKEYVKDGDEHLRKFLVDFDKSLSDKATQMEERFRSETAAPRKVPWSFWKLIGF